MKETVNRCDEWIDFLQSTEEWFVVLDQQNCILGIGNQVINLISEQQTSFFGLPFDEISAALQFGLDDFRPEINHKTNIIKYEQVDGTMFCMNWRKVLVDETFYVLLGEEVCENRGSAEILSELKENLNFKASILAAIVETSKILLDANDVYLSLFEVFKLIGEVSQVDRVYYFEKNKMNTYFSQKVEWVRGDISPQIHNHNLQNIDINIHEAGSKQLILGKPITICTRELGEGKLKELLQSQEILSMISLPIFLKHGLYGFIGFDYCTQEKNWTKDEANLLMTLSCNISHAIERMEIQYRLDFKEKILSAIGFANEKLFHSEDVYQSLKDSFGVIGEAAAVDRVCYFEKNKFNAHFHQKLEWTSENVSSFMDDPELLDIDTADYPEFFEELFRGKYYSVLTKQLDSGKLKTILENQSILSILYIPVIVFDQLHAYLGFDNCTQKRKWSNDEISVLVALATNVANAIERIENQRQLEYKATVLTAIGNTNEKLFKSNNVLETLIESFSIVGEGARVDRVYYFEKNKHNDLFSQKVEWVRGNVKPEINNPALQDMDTSLFPDFYNQLINRTHYTIRVPDLKEGKLKDILASQDIISLLNIPITVFDELHGFIGFDDCTNDRTWSEDELSILISLAQNISNAIEKIENNHRLQRKASIMHTIGLTNEKLFRSKNVFKTLQNSFHNIGRAVEADRVYYFEKDSITGLFSQKMEWVNHGISVELNNPSTQNVNLKDYDFFVSSVLKGKPYVVRVSQLQNEEFKQVLSEQSILSFLCIPIFVFDEIYGFMGFDDCSSNKQWSEDEISILTSLTNSISSALEKEENEKRLEYKAKILSAIGKINERLHNTDDISTVLEESLAMVGVAIQADRVYYFEKNKNDERFTQKLEWVRNGIHPEIENPELQNMDLELYPQLKWRIYAGHPYIFKTKELPQGAFKKMLEVQEILSILNIPLKVNGRIYGFIGFDDCTFNRVWTQEELGVLASLANNLASALEKFENQQIIISSERNFREMNETIDDVFWLYNIEMNCVDYVSPSCEKVLGKSQEFFYARHDAWKDITLPEDHAIILGAHQELLKTGSYEVQYRVKIGNEVRWIFEKSFAIVNDDGVVTRNAGLSSDITEDVKKQLELERLFELTNNQNQRLTNFAHIISHNIRSHSSNLTSLMDFLSQSPTPEETDLYMSLMQKSTDKLAETIQNLNEIITIQNYAKLETTPLNLKLEIDKTINSLSAEIKKVNADIYNNVPDNIYVNFIPAYLESVLLNFLSNAIKYRSEDRFLRVEFNISKTSSFWKLAISDNGLGIDLTKHGHKLFGMFKTFHKHPDARGMGLFIAKSQIEAMKGRVEVNSEVNKGTTFYLYFHDEN